MSATTLARDLVVAQTRALKLPGVARTFEALARQARDAHWPHEDYLHEVLTAEQASRHESVIRQRLRAYDELTGPILKWYGPRVVRSVDGSLPPKQE